MMKILHRLGFGVDVKGKESNPKKIKESILFVREDGFALGVEYCLPKDREKCVLDGWTKYPKAKFVNIIPLKGRTKVIAKTSK